MTPMTLERRFRIWAAWHLPAWMRHVFCHFGWHYWRYNVLYMGVMAPWIRHCEDAGCGTRQDIELHGKGMRWVTRRWEVK